MKLIWNPFNKIPYNHFDMEVKNYLLTRLIPYLVVLSAWKTFTWNFHYFQYLQTPSRYSTMEDGIEQRLNFLAAYLFTICLSF